MVTGNGNKHEKRNIKMNRLYCKDVAYRSAYMVDISIHQLYVSRYQYISVDEIITEQKTILAEFYEFSKVITMLHADDYGGQEESSTADDTFSECNRYKLESQYLHQ